MPRGGRRQGPGARDELLQAAGDGGMAVEEIFVVDPEAGAAEGGDEGFGVARILALEVEDQAHPRHLA